MEDSLGGPKGYLLALVKEHLRAEGFTDAEIEGGGLRVTTTITAKAQNAAVQAVKEERPTENAKGVHIGLASVEPGTGALKAMYGGPDYVEDQRNWATTGRQPGSSFKPFALAAGLENGFSLFDILDGNTYTFPDGTEVNNEFGNQYGPVDMITATEESINTAYIDLTTSMDNGPKQVIDAAVRAGHPGGRARPRRRTRAIALGTADVSTVDMANAYARSRTRAGRRTGSWSTKVTDAQRQDPATSRRSRRSGRSPRTSPPTSSRRCSRWCRTAPAPRRSPSAARRRARPAPPRCARTR